MRIMSVASRAVAVGLAVALALPTGMAAAQELVGEQSSEQTASSQSGTGSSKASDTGWKASDATSFTDFSDKKITEKDNELENGVFLAVDGQFVGGTSADGKNDQNSDDEWTEGTGPGSDGQPITDGSKKNAVWVGDYVGVTKAVPSATKNASADFLESTLKPYVQNLGVGNNGADNWSKAKSELTGDQFEGLYVYYENQLRTRLAWAGKIDGATWVVPWDDTKKADEPQCNPADATNTSKNKCFMTKLSSDAVLALSFLTAGARTVTYESAVSAGNAIGTSDTETSLDRNNGDDDNNDGVHDDKDDDINNRAKVLRTQTGVRQGRDLTFSVSLSHPGTYLRVYTKDTDDENVSACPVAGNKDNPSGDTVNNPAKDEFFGQNKGNVVYSDSPGSKINDTKTDEISVSDNASDSQIKNVTLHKALTGSSLAHMSICVQEIYWYDASSNSQSAHQVSLTSAGSTSYRSTANGGMYIKSASGTRTAKAGTYSGNQSYYPNWSAGPLGSENDADWASNLSHFNYQGCSTVGDSAKSSNKYCYSWTASGSDFARNLTADGSTGYTFDSLTTSPLTDNNASSNGGYQTASNLIATNSKTTVSGSSVSFLVTDTLRGLGQNSSDYYSQVPVSLTVCVKKTNNGCEGVSSSDLEAIDIPGLRSQPSSYFNGKTSEQSTAASAEFDLYASDQKSGITKTVTLTKGELAGVKVNVTVLPQFYRDSDSKWGGDGTSDKLKSSHPVLITLQNVNTDIDMMMNWVKTDQYFLSLGDASGVENVQYGVSRWTNSGYNRDVLSWRTLDAKSTNVQFSGWTNLSKAHKGMVVRFQVVDGYKFIPCTAGNTASCTHIALHGGVNATKDSTGKITSYSEAEDLDLALPTQGSTQAKTFDATQLAANGQYYTIGASLKNILSSQ